MKKSTIGERYLRRKDPRYQDALDELARETEEGERPARALLELVETGVDPWEFHDICFLAWKTSDVFLATGASVYLQQEGFPAKILPVISETDSRVFWVVQVTRPSLRAKAPRLS